MWYKRVNSEGSDTAEISVQDYIGIYMGLHGLLGIIEGLRGLLRGYIDY